MNEYIFCDIETIPLPMSERTAFEPTRESVKYGNAKKEDKREEIYQDALAEWKRGDGCGLDSLQGRIAVIGYAIGKKGEVFQIHDDDESAMLEDWWRMVLHAGSDIVGHNIIQFDAPMLIHRSILNGVKVPLMFAVDIRNYRPALWRDTMRAWACGVRDPRANRSLVDLCKAFGIPAKEGEVTGANFHKWWAKDRAKCLAYNADDVEAVRALFYEIEDLVCA